MRERYTSTSTLLGTAQTNMAEQKNGERIRLKLESPNPDGRTAGFVTITSWIFDLKIPASTDSTPVHRPTHGKNPTFKINDITSVPLNFVVNTVVIQCSTVFTTKFNGTDVSLKNSPQ